MPVDPLPPPPAVPPEELTLEEYRTARATLLASAERRALDGGGRLGIIAWIVRLLLGEGVLGWPRAVVLCAIVGAGTYLAIPALGLSQGECPAAAGLRARIDKLEDVIVRLERIQVQADELRAMAVRLEQRLDALLLARGLAVPP